MCAEGITLCTEAIAEVWGLGFGITLGLYLSALTVGFALSLVRKA